jgi:4-alpha-glucanotransferase
VKSDAALRLRAQAAGLQTQWNDTQGAVRHVSPQSLRALLDALPETDKDGAASCIVVDIGQSLPQLGNHRARVHCLDEKQRAIALTRGPDGSWQAPGKPGYYRIDEGSHSITLAVAPPRCFMPQDLADQRQPALWGLSAQVYSLRAEHDGGLGHSGAVARLGRRVAQAGGDVLALSPLHATSPVTGYFSPYAPSHRGLLDWMQIDPTQVAHAEALRHALRDSGAAQTWTRAQDKRSIDWKQQYALRRRVWRSLFDRWGQADAQRKALRSFMARGGSALKQHAIFAAQQAIRAQHEQGTGWHDWGPSWARPENAAVSTFARRHADDVRFEYFLQWLAAECWQKTRLDLDGAGLRLGLLWDLAVGFVPDGSEAWQHPDAIVRGATLGAPADAFNPLGQAWGISTYSPQGLRQSGYRPLIELLRATMSRGGGMRIDHILGWSRMWLVPDGASAAEGGYIRYPLEDMLRLLALESWRHRCVVIGEDLGTVPDGLRAILAQRGVLGLDVLLFTRGKRGRFLPPEQWREHAVAMTTTHDLPPLAGWRQGKDIQALGRIQAWPGRSLQAHLRARQRDIVALDRMTMAGGTTSPQRAAVASVARSAATLALIPVEDALGNRQQVNLPGTMDEHPNWRLRTHWDVPRLARGMQWIDRQRRELRHD